MYDPPYTSPEEDPFYALPPKLSHPRPRPSSMLDKWIQDQQVQPLELESIQLDSPKRTQSPRAGTPTHPYLAYPDLGQKSLDRIPLQDDACTLHSYDLIDDDDIPNTAEAELELQLPSTPNASGFNKSSKVLLTSSTFRNLNLSFRSSYPISTPPLTDDTTPSPRTSSRMSLFTRGSRQSTSTMATVNIPSQHARSSSLSTFNMPDAGQSPTVKATKFTSKWRPSVLGHFVQSSSTPSIIYTQSRPSLSSADTYHSANTSLSATTLESELPSTPSRPSFFDSVRSRNRSSASIFKPHITIASASSIWSQSHASRANLDEAMPHSPTFAVDSQESTLPRRMPFVSQPSPQYDNLLDEEDDVGILASSPAKCDSAQTSMARKPGSSLSRVGFASLNSRSQKKKKKLVISGVGAHETRKFEGVKRWCETFGEIRQITRVPNGDLHIDFRRADVADTVCRVRAKVFIAGVGSVYLSWVTGDRR